MEIFSCDDVTLVHPVNNAEPINYFGISNSFDPPEQVLQRWGYVGQYGQQIKKLGTSGQSGSTTGFIDAQDLANLDTGVHLLMTAVKNSTPSLITLGGSTSIGDGILTKVIFTRQWGHSTRVCQDFILTWEAP